MHKLQEGVDWIACRRTYYIVNTTAEFRNTITLLLCYGFLKRYIQGQMGGGGGGGERGENLE